MYGSPSRWARVGVSVVRGRLPGASEPGRPSSSQNIWPRVPSGKPSSGMTGELCSQPPDGVAEIMLPSRSMMSKCTVSPVVWPRSEEHTSELQSHLNLVCRLLLEKKHTLGKHPRTERYRDCAASR